MLNLDNTRQREVERILGFTSDVRVSFEFFPPKSEKMENALWHSVERLAPFGPSFVSVTYGAGGTTRNKTHEIVTRLQAETGIPTAAHLTCVGASTDQIHDIAERYWDAGIRHIVALEEIHQMVILCISPTQMGTFMRQTWSAVLSLSRTLKLVWQLIRDTSRS